MSTVWNPRPSRAQERAARRPAYALKPQPVWLAAGRPPGTCVRRCRRAALLAVALTGVSALVTSPAFALRGHVPAGGFGWGVATGSEELQRCTTTCQPGKPGAGDGQLSEPEGVAVNEASGDVYVVDRGNNRVEVFTASGGFVAVWGWGVKDGKSEYEVCTENCRAGLPGEGEGQLLQATSIAVDDACRLHEQRTHAPLSTEECKALDPSNGDVYVETGTPNNLGADSAGSEVVNKYSPTGNPLAQIVGPPAPQEGHFNGVKGGVEGLAVDPNGELWVLVQPEAEIDEGVDHFTNDAPVNAFGGFRGAVPGSTFDERGFAVDAQDNLYVRVLTRPWVVEFNSRGELVNPVVGEEPGEVAWNGVAVEQATGDLYVDDATSVARYGPFAKEAAGRPAGNPLIERFGEGPLQQQLKVGACDSSVASCGGGLAVSSVSGRVYVVVGSADEVQEWVPEPPNVPLVSEESVTGVTSSSASFSAQVNPRSEPSEESTSYWFEYASAEQFAREGFTNAARVPAPAGSLAAEYKASRVGVEAQGLTPGTTYRYRIVAENQISKARKEPVEGERDGKGEEVARSFTTQPPGVFGLPDGRGWELVSPPQKLGGLLLPIRLLNTIQAAAGGDAMTYPASAPTEAGAVSNAGFTQVLSSRAPGGGWSSRDLSLPHDQALALTEHPEFPAFSEDLSLATVQPLGGLVACAVEGLAQPCLSEDASEQTAYVMSSFVGGGSSGVPCVQSPPLTRCYRPLVTAANVPAGTAFGVKEGGGKSSSSACPPNPFCGPQFEAASPDLSHVVLESRLELVEGSGSSEDNLFEASDGALKFIGNGQVGSGLSGRGGSFLATGANAVSADGSRVVFKGRSGALSGLLLRDTATEETLKLTGNEGVFLSASTDDSRVYFTNEKGGPLEECEVLEVEGALKCGASGKPLDLTGGASIFAPLPGTSQDGSIAYFVSPGVLTGSEQDSGGEEAQSGQPNMYVIDAGVIRLVAVLAPTDSPDWGNNEYLYEGHVRSSADGVLELSARVSPDGRWLAFMSSRSLTGYDNHDALSGRPDQEVYLYDAHAGRVVCASCDPTGARPHGVQYTSLVEGPAGGRGIVWPPETWIAATVPGWSTSLYQSRYLTDGGRLFFNTTDPLAPQDTNNTMDVYQWEPAAGEEAPPGDNCTPTLPTYSPASSGCVSLISNGESHDPSAFLDASETGQDVFFLTTAQLRPARDLDSAYDIYDARVNGNEPEPVKPIPCQGDACAPVPSPPEDQTPGSLTFQGPGNLLAPLITPPPPKTKTAAEVRHEKLLKALKACHRDRSRAKRHACEKQARKKYGPIHLKRRK